MRVGQAYAALRAAIPDTVTIVLAAKARTASEVREAIEAGASDIGHNYVQEALGMRAALGAAAAQARWHMIGDLQTNKINKALQVFDIVQTVKALDQAAALDARAARINKVVPVYVEINIGEESAKSGLPPDADVIQSCLAGMAGLRHLAVQGLMTMGPPVSDPEELRPFFRRLRRIFESINARGLPGVQLQTLSMGMSDSYWIAIEEGATMVRLGTAVFGDRK
jgi:hypothetical protein